MSHATFLFEMPSFRRGLARTVDIGAGLSHAGYQVSSSPSEADRKALAHDWAAVGEDLSDAMAHIDEELHEPEAA